MLTASIVTVAFLVLPDLGGPFAIARSYVTDYLSTIVLLGLAITATILCRAIHPPAGAVAMTAVSIWAWEPMIPRDWIWMGCLCLTGATGHYLLIKCYDVAEASAVQPFAYLQLPFAASLGILVFGEAIRPNVVFGASLIVGAGLFTLWRQRQKG